MDFSRAVPSSRQSLLRTAASSRLCLASAIAGTTLLIPSFVRADQLWDGEVSSDWNTAANWSANALPNGEWATINTAGPNVATISADSLFTPTDVFVGNGATARLDHTAGVAQTGAGNWMTVGFNGAGSGGNGTYNLADTASTGGIFTNFGTGSGTMNAGSNLMIGRDGGTGTVNVNTSGALNIAGDLRLVDAGANSKGTLNLDAGAIVVAGNIQIAKVAGGVGAFNMSGGSISGNELRVGDGSGGLGTMVLTGGTVSSNSWTTFGGGGSTGNLTMSGGSWTQNNAGFIIGDNGTSTFDLTDGTLNVNGEYIVGQGSGNGVHHFDGGSLSTTNWVSVGRGGGTGLVEMTGGTWNHTAGVNFVIGATGPGRVDLSGGQLNVTNSALEVGENNNGTLMVSDGADLRAGTIRVGLNGGAAGEVHLDGGTVRTHRIAGVNREGVTGDGASTVYFNGSQIIGTASDQGFLTSIDFAEIEAQGLKVDTNGFELAGDQALSGPGGIVKSGEGSLSLFGALSYDGSNVVEGGSLTLPNNAAGTGDILVSDGAALGIAETEFDAQYSPENVSFAGASSIGFSFTDFSGASNTVAPLNVTDTLTLGGDLTVNVSDLEPETGTLPLISYASKSGAGTVITGELPENVSASVVDSGSLISLNVTSSSPLAWDGDSNQWNFVAANWYDEETSTDSAVYVDGRWVNFDDLATGTTDVVLNSLTVAPAGVLFENSSLPFTLSGTGSIGGTGRLIKRGDATTTISTANTYTGSTRLEGGVLSIPTFPNGGLPSPLGQSSSAPENLVLAGGTLGYTGSATTTDRGVSVEGLDSSISVTDSLVMNGPVVSSGDAGLSKIGTGSLVFTTSDTNVYGAGNIPGGAGGLEADEGMLTLTGTGLHSVTGELHVGTLEGISANLVLDQATVETGSWLAVGRGNGDAAVATVDINDSSLETGSFSSGFDGGLETNDSDQVINVNGTSSWTNVGLFRLSDSLGAESTIIVNDSAEVILQGVDDAQIGRVGTGTVTINDSGSFTSSGWLSLGRVGAESQGTVNVNGGTFRNVNPERRMIVGEEGVGILNVSGTGVASDVASQTNIGQDETADGTINLLTGGTLAINKLVGGAGASALVFDGGTLRANSANDDFIAVNTATLATNGGVFDTNGFDVTVNQVMEGPGGLTKSGSGTLVLNGASTFAGTTTVSQGTLAGSGSITGALQVNAAASVNPGDSTGTFAAGNTTISGTYVCEIDGALADRLDVTGSLTLSGATVNFDAVTAPSQAVYIIATYTSLTGTFSEVDVPAGYTVDYNYLGGNQIALVGGSATPYDAWAATFGLNPATDGAPGADPDGDGQANNIEFGFGGDPTDGGDNAKIYPMTADSNDGDSLSELLLTVAVRAGAPAFAAGSPATASFEGYQYAIEGSMDLMTFNSGVTPVAPITTGLPDAPAGYEYRTFSLNGSNGLPDAGFLRATITP